MFLCLCSSFDARALLEPLLVVEESGGEETKLVHGPAHVVVHLLAVSAETLVRVEEGGGLDHETVLLGGELLAGHVAEGEAQHEGNQGIVAVGLECGHVLTLKQ